MAKFKKPPTNRHEKPSREEKLFVWRTQVNAFNMLYGDAELIRKLIKDSVGYEKTVLSRTAILIYIMSLEALVNRAMAAFLPEPSKSWFVEREERISFEDKWRLLPLFSCGNEFDVAHGTWGKFVELIRIRNDYAHPKHDRTRYMRARSSHLMDPLDPTPWVLDQLGLKAKDIVYEQTRIPRDPTAVLPKHVDVVKAAVDGVVKELDRLLNGKLTFKNWLREDTLELFHPPGVTINDLPQTPPAERPQPPKRGKKY